MNAIADAFRAVNDALPSTPFDLGSYYAKNLANIDRTLVDTSTRTVRYGYGIQQLVNGQYQSTVPSSGPISFANFISTYQNLSNRLPVQLINPEFTPDGLYAQYDQIQFFYTGAPQTFNFLNAKIVLIEAWGANTGIRYQGSTVYRGFGGYTKAVYVTTQPGQSLYVYVGGTNTLYNTYSSTAFAALGGWNGGGNGFWSTAVVNDPSLLRSIVGGGGATDIRTTNNSDWTANLNDRILVAGGAGGGVTANTLFSVGGLAGTDGGATTTLSASISKKAGNYIASSATGANNSTSSGGAACVYIVNDVNVPAGIGGTFGQGGRSYTNADVPSLVSAAVGASGGGGGWYGGAPGAPATGGTGYASGPGLLAYAVFNQPAAYTERNNNSGFVVNPYDSANNGFCRITIIG